MQPGNESRTSVLLVDDQPFDLAALERHLAPFSLHLVKACSGEEALQRFGDEDFALVLMDVKMPGLDGFQTARLLHENTPRRPVPLIFLSGSPREEAAIVRAYESGAVDYLRKPVEPETLRAKVRVFVELYQAREALFRQQAELRMRERQVFELRQQQVEEALQESQRTLAMLMGNLPGMVFRRRPDWSFEFASEGCLELTGYPVEDFTSGARRWVDLIHPEDVARVAREAEVAFTGWQPLTLVYRLLHRGGSERWMWDRSAGVYHPDGSLRFIEGFVTDITPHKVAEAERERLMGELREAVRLRDEFLSVASHELKTPLTPLSLRLQFMMREVEVRAEGSRNEVLRKHVEAASGQVQRLTALVDSLLDATRITSGRLSLRREQDVNLADIVRTVVAGFEAQAARAGTPLELEAPGRVLGHWDALRLEQVVTNLLSNALKFGAGRTVHLRVEEQEGWARLTVRDEGIGMDESMRARLFGRFERGVSERHYGGLGLGLFITREVVQALGGHVEAESQPGQGATFTVELPCTPPKDSLGGVRHED
ncbi:sensor histidine kinase [Hyalangium rubrum]|uniref:histidine kinase n=1 Tax=Hyalangium rubrum TaxID=3103134 RepID=A0ABU5GY51_9BACT|nr:ATP-binding protein [Hyalangium sp. s54d21]MDY7226114.1 ATP-binding protein [Hyalangium sp. s54d21]